MDKEGRLVGFVEEEEGLCIILQDMENNRETFIISKYHKKILKGIKKEDRLTYYSKDDQLRMLSKILYQF